MAGDPIATRYAQAVFDAAKVDGDVKEALAELMSIGTLMRDHAELRQLLLNPDVEPQDKVGILDRLLNGEWSTLVRAFVQMVVSAGRTEYLEEIIRAFQAVVDADAGRLRVTVRSAHALSEAVLGRLRTRLERLEQKHIQLRVEVAPELLGGVQILLDHRVIDGSAQRQLVELRHRLKSIRVN